MKCKDQLRQWWNSVLMTYSKEQGMDTLKTHLKVQSPTKPFAKPKLCLYVSDKKASWSREKLSVEAELHSKSISSECQKRTIGADQNLQMPSKTRLLIWRAPVKLTTNAEQHS